MLTAFKDSFTEQYFPKTLHNGILICICGGALAYIFSAIAENYFESGFFNALVIALIIGVILRNSLSTSNVVDIINPGSKWASSKLLEVAVFLLGASISFGQIIEAGPNIFILIAISVSGGFLITWFIGHRLFGLSSRLALLIGVGNSICGNSAVAAVAPVLKANSNEITAAIGISAIMGLIQILALPFLVPLLDLTYYQYGIITGITVYAVPQVVAASFSVSTLSGQVATFVKLIRILFLGPIIVIISILTERNSNSEKSVVNRKKIQGYVPWFVTGFIVLAILRSAEIINDQTGDLAKNFSSIFFIVAMVGLGFTCDLSEVKKVGARVAVTIFFALGFMLAISLIGTSLLNLSGSA